jgi:pectin methylesterase-like acyl-CoA thioesterase
VTSANDNHLHQFVNVVRHLVLHSGSYRNEDEQTAHLAALSKFEGSSSATDARYLLSEGDHAPREDVSERVPPAGQNVVVAPAVAPSLDYDKLAAAIVAVQKKNAQDNQE